MIRPPLFFINKLKLQSAHRFENYVSQLLKKEFNDCVVTEQYRLENGLIPDFVIECDYRTVVVDAKAKMLLTKRDIDQMIEYMVELDADSGYIYVADFTEVHESIEDYAVLNAIEIEYTDWRSTS